MFLTNKTVPMAFTRDGGDKWHDMIMSMYPFIHCFELVPWLILSGTSSKSMCDCGYSPPMVQRHLARCEMDRVVHLLQKVCHQYRTRPLMNIYCKFRLARGKCWKEENEWGHNMTVASRCSNKASICLLCQSVTSKYGLVTFNPLSSILNTHSCSWSWTYC